MSSGKKITDFKLARLLVKKNGLKFKSKFDSLVFHGKIKLVTGYKGKILGWILYPGSVSGLEVMAESTGRSRFWVFPAQCSSLKVWFDYNKMAKDL